MKDKGYFTRKKLLFICGTVMLLVLAAVISILLCLDFSPEPAETLPKEPTQEALALAVESAWLSAQSPEQPAFLTKLDEMSSYELHSVEPLENGRYLLKMVVTAPDLGGQLMKLGYAQLPQENNENELNTFLCEQIDKAEVKQSEAAIMAVSVDGEYHITFSDDFVDAMSGGAYSYSRQAMVDMLQNAVKEEGA